MAILAMSLTNGTLTAVVNQDGANRIVSVRNDDARWNGLMEAYKTDNEAEVERMLSLKAVVEAFSFGDISVSPAGVTYKGIALHTLDVQRIMAFLREKVPYERYAKFVARKMKNPSARAVNEMYRFLENEFMPLTAVGTFIAYKAVQNDYYSITGNKDTIVIQGVVNGKGQILNRVGDTIEIERSSCDDNYHNGCSFGLHAGSIQYATGFGPRIILVEIDPADVVSVPDEGSFHKLRCCKYKVIGDYTGPLPQHYTDEFSPDIVEFEECPDCDGCDGHDDCTCNNPLASDTTDFSKIVLTEKPGTQQKVSLDGKGYGFIDVFTGKPEDDDEPDNPTTIEEVVPNAGISEVTDGDLHNTISDGESLPTPTPWTTGFTDGFKEEKYPKYLPGDENGADSENHRLYITGYLQGYSNKHLPHNKGQG